MVVVYVAAALLGAFSAPPLRLPLAARHRAAPPLALAPSAYDAVLDELLAVEKAEALPALLGRRLDVIADAGFYAALEERRAASGEAEGASLGQIGELVVTFLESLAGQVSQLEPALDDMRREADAVAAKAAAAAARAAANGDPPASRGATTGAADAAPADRPRGPDGLDEAQRERQARYRYQLERLLDAVGKQPGKQAGAGEARAAEARLDLLLREMSAELDAGFFEHLQWEVEQQVAAGNRRLLKVLELVVQRACVEVESAAGGVEVGLLSSLLQTRNGEARREMYERNLAVAAPSVQAAFLALASETQLELEKALMRGERVDTELLQQLRLVGIEAAEHTQLEPPSGA